MKRNEVDRTKISPMMRQYLEVKDEYLDAIVFYRLGDFYEMFFEDAVIGSKELELALKKVYETDNEALVEEVLNGIEISVPIISGKVYPPVRIDSLKSTYFDYNSKYDKDGANEYVYFFEEELQNEINEFTKKAYYATKCKGFARIDYIIQDNKAYLIEINTLPGMTKTSLLPKSLAHLGYTYSKTLDLLIEASINDKI